MYWDDTGFLISKNKFNENAVIAEIYTLNHGKCSGIIYGGSTIYNPYTSTTNLPTRDWLGDSLKIQIELESRRLR